MSDTLDNLWCDIAGRYFPELEPSALYEMRNIAYVAYSLPMIKEVIQEGYDCDKYSALLRAFAEYRAMGQLKGFLR